MLKVIVEAAKRTIGIDINFSKGIANNMQRERRLEHQ
jgi:hypothetical protein